MELVFLIIGIATGLLLGKLIDNIKAGKVALSWYHWVIGICWYAGVALLVSFIGTSIEEQEPQAAGMAILLFGGALLVVTLLVYRTLYRPRIFPACE